MTKTNSKVKKVLKSVLFLGWLLFIFYFSSQNSEVSLSVSNQFVLRIKKVLDCFSFLNIDSSFLIRKLAHFSLYFFLAFISYSLLKEYFSHFYKNLFFSFLICFVYACSDEFHQLFVPGRNGTYLDILVDCSGALLSLFFIFLFHKMKKIE